VLTQGRGILYNTPYVYQGIVANCQREAPQGIEKQGGCVVYSLASTRGMIGSKDSLVSRILARMDWPPNHQVTSWVTPSPTHEREAVSGSWTLWMTQSLPPALLQQPETTAQFISLAGIALIRTTRVLRFLFHHLTFIHRLTSFKAILILWPSHNSTHRY